MNWFNKLFEIPTKATPGEWWVSTYDDGRKTVDTCVAYGGGVIDIEVTDEEFNCEHIARFDPPTVKLMLDVISEVECTQDGNDVQNDLYKALQKLKAHVGGG